MIEVIYHREYDRLTVKGHAQSAEPGHDLVCASASILTYTLAANVGQMGEAGQLKIDKLELNNGDAEIEVTPIRRYSAIVRQRMQSVIVGFEILATNHPEYISYEVLG